MTKSLTIWVSITGSAGNRTWKYYDKKNNGNEIDGNVDTPSGEVSEVTWQRIETSWTFEGLLVDATAPVVDAKTTPAKITGYVNNAVPPQAGEWKYVLNTTYGLSPDPKIINDGGSAIPPGKRGRKPKPKPKKRAKASKPKKASKKKTSKKGARKR